MASQENSHTSVSLLGRLADDPEDARAWADFVRRYGRKIYAWCRAWNLQDADAEDVTQNVLLDVARGLKKFRYDPTRSFRAWLKTLTHAAWYDWKKRQRRQEQALDALTTLEARDDLERRLEEQFDLELLEEAVARVRKRVGPRTWDAFRLLAQEGLSGTEAAARLGMKVGAVYVARSRVQKLLQDEVSTLDPSTPLGGE